MTSEWVSREQIKAAGLWSQRPNPSRLTNYWYLVRYLLSLSFSFLICTQEVTIPVLQSGIKSCMHKARYMMAPKCSPYEDERGTRRELCVSTICASGINGSPGAHKVRFKSQVCHPDWTSVSYVETKGTNGYLWWDLKEMRGDVK